MQPSILSPVTVVPRGRHGGERPLPEADPQDVRLPERHHGPDVPAAQHARGVPRDLQGPGRDHAPDPHPHHPRGRRAGDGPRLGLRGAEEVGHTAGAGGGEEGGVGAQGDPGTEERGEREGRVHGEEPQERVGVEFMLGLMLD